MIEAALQYVIAASSALTATGVAYIAREAHEARQQIAENEERSVVNRAVLRREGMISPVTKRPKKEDS